MSDDARHGSLGATISTVTYSFVRMISSLKGGAGEHAFDLIQAPAQGSFSGGAAACNTTQGPATPLPPLQQSTRDQVVLAALVIRFVDRSPKPYARLELEFFEQRSVADRAVFGRQLVH